ncbi:hypothetical protein TELCIR_11093, partial [Teladorsagia circumcincta]
MFIEMRDPLPWARLSHPEAVLGLKEETTLEKLCSSDLSKVFLPILKTFEKLGYFDRPDYKKIFEMLMEEVTRMKVNLTDPYDWDGKITDTEGAEKLQEVCKQYDLKIDTLPKMETVEDLSEENEQAYFRQVFSPQPTDVPGGEQYEEKRKRGNDEQKHQTTSTATHTAAGASSLSVK